MTEREKKYLSDIVTSVELIENFTESTTSFTEYENDPRTKAAVERHLGIIGEAVSKFLKASETNELKYASQIISLSNRIIHSYDNVDDSIVWAIITRHLKSLKKEANEKLQ